MAAADGFESVQNILFFDPVHFQKAFGLIVDLGQLRSSLALDDVRRPLVIRVTIGLVLALGCGASPGAMNPLDDANIRRSVLREDEPATNGNQDDDLRQGCLHKCSNTSVGEAMHVVSCNVATRARKQS
jgi:hypothetical protein